MADNVAKPEPTAREIVMSLMASATLADHMGEMWDDLFEAAKQVGIKVPKGLYDEVDIHDWLAKMGAKTVNGTDLTIGGGE